ncbi:phage tail protein [Pseudomonas sp. DWRC2-2]|uniref:phage tail protein n=1 Tax=Pseudomonas sp. DWRC2-2 TaxID=2804567 RepID=UPI003CF2924C
MVDKNSIFGGMITTTGAAKKTNCDALGIPWEPRYMLIGDANGADPVPNPSQTKLVNQVYRAQINQLRVSPTDANVLIAEVVLPPDVGGWWVRELALEDKDGVFSAVANAPPSYKPVLAQGSGRNQVVRMHIITSGTSNIQLKIDPAVVLATRQYVDEAVNGLLPANKVAGTYTKVKVNDRGVFLSGSNPTTLAGYGITDTYTKEEIAAMIAQASALPVGSMIGVPVSKVSPGFLELDGSVKSVAAYPDLATFLGGAFNKGDEGAGNFRLPESRGEFLRGWDHGRGIDAGRAIGSYQLDALQNIKGDFTSRSFGGAAGAILGGTAPSPFGGTKIGAGVAGTTSLGGGGGTVAADVTTFDASLVARTSTETRGRNLAVMWCIKAWNAPINQGNIDIAALVSLAAQATEINQGTAKVATDAQMLDSANDAVIATPKKLRKGFAVSLGLNGYLVFPSWLGGLILQWGSVAVSSTSGVISFPLEFPGALYTVVGSPIGTSYSSGAGGGAIAAGSRIGATVYVWGTGNFTFRWMALGS